jgi:hypothetical protein
MDQSNSALGIVNTSNKLRHLTFQPMSDGRSVECMADQFRITLSNGASSLLRAEAMSDRSALLHLPAEGPGSLLFGVVFLEPGPPIRSFSMERSKQRADNPKDCE